MNVIVPPLDPLADLPPDIHADMRGILERIAAAGLPLERNPNMPSMVATKVENTIFQITVLHEHGVPLRVAILGPGARSAFGNPEAIPLREWPREDFLILLPEIRGVPEPAPANILRAYEPLPDEREILLEIRNELRAIRALVGGPLQ